MIEPSFWWIRLWHGFNIKKVQDGVAAIRGSHVAVLLLQRSADQGTRLEGAERLRDANPDHTALVVIRDADHEWFSPGRPEVMKQVVAWFDAHAHSRRDLSLRSQ